MLDFKQFLASLLKNPSNQTRISVNGKVKEIKAMAKLASLHYLKDSYIKIIFNDGSFLLIQPADEEVYYAQSLLGKVQDIPDEDIGNKELLIYKEKRYKLGNKDDYQFCLQLYVGSPMDIEGECRFSDYFPESGPKEYLSLGWLMRTGERADINCTIIDFTELSIV